MSENKTKSSIFTMIVSMTNTILLVILNLIYNKLVIETYGSEINGLISTLLQFVNLFMIAEGGFTTAAIVATYEPIVKKKYEELNNVLYTAKKQFFWLGLGISFAVLISGIVYLLFIDSPISYIETYCLLFIMVMTTCTSMSFYSKYSILLYGDNKEYVLTLTNIFAKLFTWIISIVLIIQHKNIIIVYLMNLVYILIAILFARIYEKKRYKYVTYKGVYNKELIKGTGDVVFQKIASTIFTSTDLVLISVCIDFKAASVYNLYFQIFKSVMTALSSVIMAPFNSFGQIFNSGNEIEKGRKYFNIYEKITLLFSTIILSIASIATIPFVKIYTKKFVDANYVSAFLVILFFSQMYAQIVNRPYGVLLNVTGNFKMQNRQCLLGAIVNIIVSVMFVDTYGMYSIIFGSFVGTCIILVMNIWQAYKKVLKQSMFRSVVVASANFIMGLLLIIISMRIDIIANNYFVLCAKTCVIGIFSTLVIIAINYLLDKNGMREVHKYIFSIFKSKNK